MVVRDAVSGPWLPIDWAALSRAGAPAPNRSVVEDRLEALPESARRSVAEFIRANNFGPTIDTQVEYSRLLDQLDRAEARDLGPLSARRVQASGRRRRRSNAERAFDYFVGKGFTKRQAAGIVGNLMQESGVNPRSNQLGGGPGRGIAQWSVGERWQDLLRFARRRDRNPRSLRTQLDFIMREFRTTESRAFRGVKRTRTIRDATETFERLYERAGTPNLARRIRLARQAFRRFA